MDGVVADGRLTFTARDGEGERRLTFTDGGPNAFRQLSERSTDGGATWATEYDFHYRRLADDQDGAPGRRGHSQIHGSRPVRASRIRESAG